MKWEQFVPVQPMDFVNSYHKYIVKPGDPSYGTIWELYEFKSDDRDSRSLMMLPDACTDIILSLSNVVDAITIYRSATSADTLKYFTPKPSVTYFGIRFVPGEYNRLLLNENVGMFGSGYFSTIMSGFIKITNTFNRNADNVLQLFHEQDKKNRHEILDYIINKIAEAHGHMSCCSLSTEMGYSDNYIRKIFKNYSGMSIKRYAEIMKFQYTLNLLANSSNKIGETVDLSGYYDISHLDKCFKKLMGGSSKQLMLLLQGINKRDIII